MGRSGRFPNLGEFRAATARRDPVAGERDGPPTAPGPAGSTPGPMVYAWLAVGLAALGLLGWTLTSDPAPRAASSLGSADAPPAAPAEAPVRTGTIDGTVARALAGVDDRIDGLDRAQSVLRARQGELEERLAVIEEAFGPTSGSIPDRTARRAPGAATASAKGDAPPTSLLPPALARGGTGAVTGGGGQLQFGVDLGAFADQGTLVDSWQLLLGKFGETLTGLTPLQVTRMLADGTPSYRLIAGPFADIAAAGRVCADLRARGVDCSQSVHQGAPL